MLLTQIHLLVIPVGVLIYTHLFEGVTRVIIVLVYIYVSQFYFKARFGLMLHCICHRRLFKRRYSWLFTYVTWMVCPFFGHSPETYFSHHMGMHHRENNTIEDSSSTLPYQRDELKDFVAYFFNFLFRGFKTTFSYLYLRRRKKLYTRFMLGEFSFFLFCILMCFISVNATIIVFIFPFFFARLQMMIGNWTHHAFVDKEHPENVFTNSISCINIRFNKICWNDGYHAVHHLKPGLHYTEMPFEFLKIKDALVTNKSLVFDGLGYLSIFFFLLTKQYGRLADNVVNIDEMFSTQEEVIELMKSRTTKVLLEPTTN